MVGIDNSDDAGVYRVAPDLALVQTVDFFTPVVDDPRDWGRIASANALSDIYAMGGTPITALQMIGWPRNILSFEMAARVIEGGAEVMADAGCTIVGGHSIDDAEPKYGFAVTGLIDPGRVVTNAGAAVGDSLFLTKPIGTGIISTAIKRETCPPEVAAEAVRVMTMLNREAAEAMLETGVDAATDVTGFGLLGHLAEMLAASGGLGAILDPEAVPVIPGTRQLLEQGMFPGGSQRNLEAVAGLIDVGDPTARLLADAQTSGGLLIAVSPARETSLMTGLSRRGVVASRIGVVDDGPGIRW